MSKFKIIAVSKNGDNQVRTEIAEADFDMTQFGINELKKHRIYFKSLNGAEIDEKETYLDYSAKGKYLNDGPKEADK